MWVGGQAVDDTHTHTILQRSRPPTGSFQHGLQVQLPMFLPFSSKELFPISAVHVYSTWAG